MVRKTKAQKREEMNEIFENANYNLTMVSQDHTVPRNIRKVAQESVDAIAKMDMDGKNQDNSPAIAASTAGQPRMPLSLAKTSFSYWATTVPTARIAGGGKGPAWQTRD